MVDDYVLGRDLYGSMRSVSKSSILLCVMELSVVGIKQTRCATSLVEVVQWLYPKPRNTGSRRYEDC